MSLCAKKIDCLHLIPSARKSLCMILLYELWISSSKYKNKFWIPLTAFCYYKILSHNKKFPIVPEGGGGEKLPALSIFQNFFQSKVINLKNLSIFPFFHQVTINNYHILFSKFHDCSMFISREMASGNYNNTLPPSLTLTKISETTNHQNDY